MIVTSVQATPKIGRRERPMRDALQTLDASGHTLIEITTDTGIVGKSSIYFGRIERGPAVLASFINEVLAPAVVGRDASFIRGIRADLWKLTDYHGSVGFALNGIAGIDIALWDVLGKSLGQPVWRLLGAQRERVPAYAMVGWLNYDVAELQAICVQAIEQEFRGVKMKVGAPTLAEDIARIKAVRTAIGDEPLVMVDANQVFSVPEAMIRGQAYQDLGCYWFEEPLRADDHAGLAQLAQRLDIPVASGENDFGKRQFRDLFERGSVDIVQPDLRRAGGFTECLEIGLMADAFNIPYASHGGGVHLHVLAALPNTLMMESGLLPKGSPIQLVDGCYPLPTAPGFGDE